jgi:hypothetical protein
VEIVVELADALISRGVDPGTIIKRYREAFGLDRDHPRALVGVFLYRVSEEGLDLPESSLLGLMLDKAIRRCQDQIEVGVNLPAAYYNLGELYLLERNVYECLNAYAKAIQCSAALSEKPHLLETALERVNCFEKATSLRPLLRQVRQLLQLGLAARFGQPLASELQPPQGRSFKTPVVIVAGGCDPAIEEQMRQYGSLFEQVFRNFEGTIISGGTRNGVCGLMGDMARKPGATVHLVTYAPRQLPEGVRLDREAYEVREAGEEGFGPEQPLQNWIDLLAAHIRPDKVRLIGINGGQLAAFEYRLALALGADIGVIENSGRAADTLIQDVEWRSMTELLRLPPDPMTVWSYLCGSREPWLDAEQREQFAQRLHQRYLEEEKRQLPSAKPTLVEWPALPESYKDSNRQQVDYLVELLRVLGIDVVPLGSGEAPEDLRPDEAERVAEMEHGRWCVEKFRNGWRRGKKRDDANKLHPDLVSWEELPLVQKNKNRRFAREIPVLLNEIGLGLRHRQPAQ